MSYIINKTDGTVLTEVVDGTIDQIKTDLTLIGKNSSSYGEFFNENFVHLLENFANASQPNHPVEGQLWYDTSEGRLKVYDGNGFKVSGGTIVSNTAPSSIAAGDIWIDSYRKQLYFNDGNSNLLAGPSYTAQQGISGLQVTDVIDTNGINHTVVFLYVGQVLLGIFSNSTFTARATIPGFTGTAIKVGFTSAYDSVKFNVAATQADSLASNTGLKTAESFLQVNPADGYTVANGTIRVLNNNALILGAGQNTEVVVSNNTFQINSNIPNQNFEIKSWNSAGVQSSLYVNASNSWVGLYNNNPQATLHVGTVADPGDVIIEGNLTVKGATTTINTTNLVVEDLLIDLGVIANPTDNTADGGGLSLKGDTDKTLTWSLAHTAWESSESFNLTSGNTYKINNFEVLSQTQLGNTVTSAPGLNSIGQLNDLQVDNININGNVISFLNISISDGTIYITPKGEGTLDVGSKFITNVKTPIPDDESFPSPGTTAANKLYVDTRVRKAPLGFSVIFGSYTETTLATTVISKIFRPADHDDDTILRVWCIDLDIGKEYKLVSGIWLYQTDI